MTADGKQRTLVARLATLGLVCAIWFAPAPAGLRPEAWHLFALFAGAIVAVLLSALPILTSSVATRSLQKPGAISRASPLVPTA